MLFWCPDVNCCPPDECGDIYRRGVSKVMETLTERPQPPKVCG